MDVRVIAATNRNLLASVQDKTFREDLYYRLNVIHLRVPPLRERMEDLKPLLDTFLSQFSRDYNIPTPEVTADAMKVLMEHSWPGNVRELKNVAERLIVRAHSGDHRIPRVCHPELLRGTPETADSVAAAAQGRADLLFDRLTTHRESFWTVVYPLFMDRDMTRDDLRAIIRRGLEPTSGSYRVLTDLFNMRPDDYKRFLNFLRKHNCQEAFQPYRSAGPRGEAAAAARPEADTSVEGGVRRLGRRNDPPLLH